MEIRRANWIPIGTITHSSMANMVSENHASIIRTAIRRALRIQKSWFTRRRRPMWNLTLHGSVTGYRAQVTLSSPGNPTTRTWDILASPGKRGSHLRVELKKQQLYNALHALAQSWPCTKGSNPGWVCTMMATTISGWQCLSACRPLRASGNN